MKDLYDSLLRIVVSSKQRRYGSVPTIGSLDKILTLITDSVERGLPIPFLCPWACSKQGNNKLDILECYALNTLQNLQDEVSAIYSPGIRVYLRVEDYTDVFLFSDEPGILWKISQYRSTLLALVVLTQLRDFVEPVVESRYLKPEFSEMAASLSVLFKNYLDGGPLEPLQEIGWKGEIPEEQRQYYYRCYRHFYSGISMDQCSGKLAEYFACTMARIMTGGDGAPCQTIKLSFNPPVPGSPMGAGRIYYRTLPQNCTNHHKAPWIGQGYYIMEDRKLTPKIASFNEHLPVAVKHRYRLVHPLVSINIPADIVLPASREIPITEPVAYAETNALLLLGGKRPRISEIFGIYD